MRIRLFFITAFSALLLGACATNYNAWEIHEEEGDEEFIDRHPTRLSHIQQCLAKTPEPNFEITETAFTARYRGTYCPWLRHGKCHFWRIDFITPNQATLTDGVFNCENGYTKYEIQNTYMPSETVIQTFLEIETRRNTDKIYSRNKDMDRSSIAYAKEGTDFEDNIILTADGGPYTLEISRSGAYLYEGLSSPMNHRIREMHNFYYSAASLMDGGITGQEFLDELKENQNPYPDFTIKVEPP